MGKAPQIKDLEQDNQKFAEFMKVMENEMQTNSEKYRVEFDSRILDFYGGSIEGCRQIASREHFDYQFETEFSMERIQEIIQKTSSEVFGTMEKEEKELSEALKSYEEMAAKMAISFLSNVLASLTWGQTAEYRYNIQQIPVGPGLTLHLLVVEKYYDGKTFFHKKKIIQNFICYKVYFSEKLAMVEAKVQYLKDCLAEMEENSKFIAEMRKKWLSIIMSKEYIQESREGELHCNASNMVMIIQQLKVAYDEAYECVNKLFERQEVADKTNRSLLRTAMNRDISMSAPNGRLLKYLEGER